MNRRTFMTTAAMVGVTGCATSNSTGETDSQRSETSTHSNSAPPSEQTVSDEPSARTDFGTEYTVDTVGIEFESAQVVQALRTVDGDVIAADSDKLFLLIRIRATNRANSTAKLPPRQAFTVRTREERYHAIALSRYLPGEQSIGQSWPSPFYNHVYDIPAGEVQPGFLVFEVPTETTMFTFEWSDMDLSEVLMTWQGAVDPTHHANMTLTSIESPPEVENGDSITFSVTVRNDGPAAGVFHPTYDITRSIGPRKPGRIVDRYFNEVIQPGETRSIERSVTTAETQELSVTVADAHTTRTNVVPATRPFGTSYTTSHGVRVTANRPVLSEAVTVGTGAENVMYDSTANEAYATFEITVENVADSELKEPDRRWLSVHANGHTDSMVGSAQSPSSSLVDPIDGEFYRGDSLYLFAPGETISGVAYATVPKDTRPADVLIRLAFPDPAGGFEVCEWSVGGS